MTLAEIEIGQQVLIHQVRGQGALRRRLLEMGLTPNTMVCVRKMAPMGDPIELHVRGYSLTLRKEDANLIDVGEPCGSSELRHGLGWRHQQRHGGKFRE